MLILLFVKLQPFPVYFASFVPAGDVPLTTSFLSAVFMVHRPAKVFRLTGKVFSFTCKDRQRIVYILTGKNPVNIQFIFSYIAYIKRKKGAT